MFPTGLLEIGGAGASATELQIGESVIGGTTGSILFIGAGPVLSQDNANLFWDDANNRLLLGHNAVFTVNNGSITPKNQSVNNAINTLSLASFVAAGFSQISLCNSRSGTIGTFTAVQSGDVLGVLNFQGADGSRFAVSAAIFSEVSGSVIADSVPSNLIFSVTPSGGISPAERFRLGGTETVFNEASFDVDFRIESNGITNIFFVDAGTDTLNFNGLSVWSAAANFAQGADIASAATTNIATAAGNFVNVTGTTTITALGTVQAGTQRDVRFTEILILTHNATSLILPTAANITTQAGDRAKFVSLGSGNWLCLYYQRADGTALAGGSGGNFVKSVYAQTGAVSTTTTAIPADDTIPQNTEGAEVITVTITPANSNNKLYITGHINWSRVDANVSNCILALFQDTTANALAATGAWQANAAAPCMGLDIFFEMTAGTTSATTFKLRAGSTAGSTVTFNGFNSARLFGGVAFSNISVIEVTT